MKRAWDWFVVISSPLMALEIWVTENVALLRFSAALLMLGILLDAVESRHKARFGIRAAVTEETGGGE